MTLSKQSGTNYRPEWYQKIDWPLCFIVIFALLIRVFYLDLRPPHSDEAVDGFFVDQIAKKGFFSYDPENYHGPLHYYVLFVFQIIFGRSLWVLRLPSVIYGVGTVFLLSRFKRYGGSFPAYLTALFVAISPAVVTYSRNAIHESGFLFYSILVFWGYFRFRYERDKRSLWCLGIGLAGMVTTKEVYVIHGMAFIAAFFILKILERFFASTEVPKTPNKTYSAKDVGLVSFVSLFGVGVFYSAFFMDGGGVFRFFTSFYQWLITGVEGRGHEKPFYYWLYLFYLYEWPTLLGMVFLFRVVFPAPQWIRFIGCYGFTVFLIYSVIPYKTPWCSIEILWPFLFVISFVFWEWSRKTSAFKRLIIVLIIFLSLGQTARAVDVNFIRPADQRIHYHYVQPQPQIMELHSEITKMVQEDPRIKHLQVAIIFKKTWPLPWLLGDFTRVAWFRSVREKVKDAAIIFCDARNRAPLEMKLTERYLVRKISYQVPNAKDLLVYFNAERFKEVFEKDNTLLEFVPTEPVPSDKGFVAKFYEGAKWEGEPVKIDWVEEINAEWKEYEAPWPPPFGIIYEGDIFVPQEGEITFYLASDDGSDFQIDGKILIKNLGKHPERMKFKKKFFKKGWHPVRVRYNDMGGFGAVRLWWKLAGRQKEILSQDFVRVQDQVKNK